MKGKDHETQPQQDCLIDIHPHFVPDVYSKLWSDWKLLILDGKHWKSIRIRARTVLWSRCICNVWNSNRCNLSHDEATEVNDMENDRLLNAKQTADYLSCSVQHVLRLAVLRQIPAVDLASSDARQRMWRFREQALEQWIRERENG